MNTEFVYQKEGKLTDFLTRTYSKYIEIEGSYIKQYINMQLFLAKVMIYTVFQYKK